MLVPGSFDKVDLIEDVHHIFIIGVPMNENKGTWERLAPSNGSEPERDRAEAVYRIRIAQDGFR